MVNPEGGTLELDGSVVDNEKAMRENQRKRKGVKLRKKTLGL